MKKFYVIALVLLILTKIYSQKTEYRLNINSGLFSFKGASAEKNSILFYYDGDLLGHSYTNNPYDSKNELCFGLSETPKHIAKEVY